MPQADPQHQQPAENAKATIDANAPTDATQFRPSTTSTYATLNHTSSQLTAIDRAARRRPQRTNRPPSLLDFMTDGSLPSICDQLSRLTGSPIWLRDRSGDIVVPGGPDQAWSVLSPEDGITRAAHLVGAIIEPNAHHLALPIRISAGVIGELVTPRPQAAAKGAHTADSLVVALERLAAHVAESCESRSILARRIDELDALFRLTAKLAEANDLDDMLAVTLEIAMDLLEADAGSLDLIDREKNALDLKVSTGLSQEWLAQTAPLNTFGHIRDAALAGDVVRVPDMTAEPRIKDHNLIRREGLISAITTGMLHHGRAIGLIRLYTRKPRRYSDAEAELLRALSEQAATAVANARLQAFREENTRIQSQVRLAAQVQQRMLPTSFPNTPRFEMAARYWPSFELGGDFYDFFTLDNKHLAITVGDVVGKGVAAALLMAAVRASLRAHAQDINDLDEVLSRVNAALCADTLVSEFATMWFGVADPDELRLTYCGAGHEWPILYRPPLGDRKTSDADLIRLTADGMALGIDPQQRYPMGIFHLKPGDMIIAFTDGLTDAANFESKRFGGTRLRNTLVDLFAAEPQAPAARVVDHVFWTLRQFTGLAKRTDDITLIAVKVLPDPSA